MSKKSAFSKAYRKYMGEHPRMKMTVEYAFVILMCLLSSFTYALAYRIFIAPDLTGSYGIQIHFVSGGVSGLAQNLVKLVHDIFGWTGLNPNNLQSILYFVLNIPVFLLGWFKIGKQFTIFSLINVALTSLFISIIPSSWDTAVVYDSQLTRTLFAGILAGLSAALAFKADVSSGGMDIVAYYFANRKSEGVGKYSIIANSFVFGFYFILNLIQPDAVIHENFNNIGLTEVSLAITSLISSIIYTFMHAFVVDLINVRNKKSQVQIITNDHELAKKLITEFPHGATTVEGIGAFTGQQRSIIYMTVSSNETTRLVKFVQENDSHAFINVLVLRQVFGRFYIKPVK
ncbi:MAG TPA: YitT family protein [Bacilli bacterium]|nr:YitT family protein [Bacilli bacterium]